MMYEAVKNVQQRDDMGKKKISDHTAALVAVVRSLDSVHRRICNLSFILYAANTRQATARVFGSLDADGETIWTISRTW